MHSCSARHCIVPPYILENLARRGSAEQRDRALVNLSLDSSLRVARLHELFRTANLATEGSAEPSAPGPVTAPTAQAKRTIRDCGGREVIEGPVVRSEGQAANVVDPAVDEAYEGLGATWKLYWEIFGRDSIDGRGLALDAYVHYGTGYDNAFWDGSQMVFGDGDGELFRRFTVAVDVIGHELTHGVTQLEAGLVYQGQPGALNESLSDVFGSLVKQFAAHQSAEQADWLIGKELLTDAVQGEALRSMRAPGTAYDDPVLGRDPQPATMKGYVRTTRDNGGVHVNSGIPNHAFYLLAVALGGRSWERAGMIWYDALRSTEVRSTATFRTFATATVHGAAARFGAGSDEERATTQAWISVGVL